MGRKRIEIALVKNSKAKQATFLKRRTGLFKKANELSILCDAKVAIVVFSPGNKPHSFGHPAVNVVAAEFLPQNLKSNKVQSGSSFDVPKVDQFNLQLVDAMKQLYEDEKRSAIILDEAMNQHMGIQISQLQKSYHSLLNLKLRVESCISDIEAAETLILFSQEGVEFPLSQKKKKQKIM